jgi:hypothetical protein
MVISGVCPVLGVVIAGVGAGVILGGLIFAAIAVSPLVDDLHHGEQEKGPTGSDDAKKDDKKPDIKQTTDAPQVVIPFEGGWKTGGLVENKVGTGKNKKLDGSDLDYYNKIATSDAARPGSIYVGCSRNTKDGYTKPDIKSEGGTKLEIKSICDKEPAAYTPEVVAPLEERRETIESEVGTGENKKVVESDLDHYNKIATGNVMKRETIYVHCLHSTNRLWEGQGLVAPGSAPFS